MTGRRRQNIARTKYKEVWNINELPKKWGKTFNYTINKKGVTSNWSNTREICLSMVTLELYTKILLGKIRNLVETR